MTENIKNVFKMLGVEPYEKFKIKGSNDEGIYRIDADLLGFYQYKDDEIFEFVEDLVVNILNGNYEIIKFTKKKKLRDLTEEEYNNWQDKHCHETSCNSCIFRSARCTSSNIHCWIHNKDLFSSKFLDQEIEIE